MTLKEGTLLGSYEILRQLGAGGMGEVWRAKDTRLEREVALKVLPAETRGDEKARARLLREARLASKLNHPNICTIHEVGEVDGQAYIAMELVEGESLSDRLAEGRLELSEAIRLGQQMADALAHAHQKAVVHRDFKSPNVIVTEDGRAKVLDFGLAQRLMGDDLDAATTMTQEALTEAGAIVGTLAYMAPEQLKGRTADERSDVWALGVVLQEMVTGERPFAGQSALELCSAILSESPRALPPSVPPGMAAIVERCLAKEQSQRYQRAGEVRSALEALLAGSQPSAWPTYRSVLVANRRRVAVAALVAIVAIAAGLELGGLRERLFGSGVSERNIRLAVLPFANLTGDPEQEYLSDGLTQEMITQLGRLHPETLSVIARSSVMRYKEGDTPVDQIGEELNVEYVLEGSAQREDNRVRIAAQLIHVQDQTQVWADIFERELSGILTLQSELAERVAEALALKLLPEEQDRLSSAREVNPEAYEAYLKGTYHWQKMTPADLDTAQRYLELARDLDPDYAPAYEGLSFVWMVREQMGLVPYEDAAPRARAAAYRAVELDERSAGAHFALAGVKTWRDWDWPGAWPEWRRALELNPNYAEAHAFYGHFLATIGRLDEALAHSQRAVELDPFDAMLQGLYAVVLAFHERYDDAVAAAQTALALQPTEPMALFVLQLGSTVTGQYEDTMAATRTILDTFYGGDAELQQALATGWEAGRFATAMRSLGEAIAERLKTSYSLPSEAGNYFLFGGDLDRALDMFEKAYDLHDSGMPYIGMPFYFDHLHSDPRYQELLRKMNLPPRPDQPLELEEP